MERSAKAILATFLDVSFPSYDIGANVFS